MYPLTPIIHADIKETLLNSEKIHEWMVAFGSPLNIIYPKIVINNLLRFHDVLKSHKLMGTIFYAYKANKSIAILKQLSVSNGKVDVASERELQQAISAGLTGSRIEATGPKNQSFIRLALMHGVTINLNSMEELESVLDLKKKLNIVNPTDVFLRIKEFKSSKVDIVQKDAKFGLNIDDARKALKILDRQKTLNFIGFSFHLVTTSEQERIAAIEQSLKLTLQAIKQGLNPKGINIGGGFSLNYLENAEQWNKYVSATKNSLLDSSSPTMSWNQSGLGFWAEKGKIRGTAMFSDFYRPYDQFEELNRVLSAKLPTFGTISQFLQENMLELYIEPGRSLLDQAGITLTRVESTNQSLKGESVIFLGMNRSNINSIELEFMSDPVLIPSKNNKKRTESKNGVFLSGNLCLPHDFICRRKVFLPLVPQPGDILVFVNTAGYFMDFTESETIQHPIAHKIAMDSGRWSIDEKYEPYLN